MPKSTLLRDHSDFIFYKISNPNHMKRILFVFASILLSQGQAQALRVSVPFELFGEHIIIKVNVNGSEPLDFVFDTGDGLTMLDLERAKELGINSDKKVKETSAGGTVTGYLVKHNDIKLGEFELHNVKIYENSLRHLEMAIGRNIDGIIGYDILNHHVVKIDYDNMLFELYDKTEFSYSGSGQKIDFKINHYTIPQISCQIELANGEKLTGEFMLNTGAATTVDFNTPFVTSNDLTNKIGSSYVYMVAGLGKVESEHHKGKINLFSLGSFSFDQMPVGCSHASSGVQADDKSVGIIGNTLLKKFNIYFDYINKQIILEKNKKFDEPFQLNASGFSLQMNKKMDKVLVHRVFNQGFAAGAGIKKDDQVVSVDGKSISDFTLPELRAFFNESGKSVKLKVIQEGTEKEITLTLKTIL